MQGTQRCLCLGARGSTRRLALVQGFPCGPWGLRMAARLCPRAGSHPGCWGTALWGGLVREQSPGKWGHLPKNKGSVQRAGWGARRVIAHRRWNSPQHRLHSLAGRSFFLQGCLCWGGCLLPAPPVSVLGRAFLSISQFSELSPAPAPGIEMTAHAFVRDPRA